LVEDRISAEVERIGAMMLPLGRLVAAELEHLVARDLRIVGREVARLGIVVVEVVHRGAKFASIGRWQPAQLVVQDRWQVKQAMFVGSCASSSPARRARTRIRATNSAACASAWSAPRAG
jgi:hypothetical protein